MARTYKKVRYSPSSKERKHTPITAASGVEQAFKFLEGRWKLVILFHLFGGKVLRFSELQRAIPAISEKMLIQQLRQLERDGIVRRIVHHQVPPNQGEDTRSLAHYLGHRNLQSTARYTALAPDRFKGFWKD